MICYGLPFSWNWKCDVAATTAMMTRTGRWVPIAHALQRAMLVARLHFQQPGGFSTFTWIPAASVCLAVHRHQALLSTVNVCRTSRHARRRSPLPGRCCPPPCPSPACCPCWAWGRCAAPAVVTAALTSCCTGLLRLSLQRHRMQGTSKRRTVALKFAFRAGRAPKMHQAC